MAKLLKSKKDLEFYLEDFMEYCSLKELSRKTINSYESTLMLFFKYLKEEYMVSNLTEVTLEHIDGYLKFTKERGKYSLLVNYSNIGLNKSIC